MVKPAVTKKCKTCSDKNIKSGKKLVYFFGDGKADGKAEMKNLLGGKGANLAEMAGHPRLKLPVPPGFTITTDVCTYYWNSKRAYPKSLNNEVEKNIAKIEKITGRKFGSVNKPLLLSVRSGARSSMPGMMETILNAGLTEKTIPALVKETNNERFVYDAYRRLIMMYADVVMEKAQGIEPKGDGIRRILDKKMEELKKKKRVQYDTDLSAGDLKKLCSEFKAIIKKVLKKSFPDDPQKQLWGAIGAVFASWQGKRAVSYRNIERIPHHWGTAVNVQTMVFGNMGSGSATGVAFTRNPATGDNHFYGEYLMNAQGEDVVAGTRTPSPINKSSASEQSRQLVSLDKAMPKIYKELDSMQKRLEKHYRDMLDIEFTIEKGKLWILQCRVGKRNGISAVRMAMDMLKEKLIDAKTAVMRVSPSQLDELLHPTVDPKAESKTKPIAKGLPAGPGGAYGMVVFNSADAVKWHKSGKKVILVREETNPEDVEGMRAAEAVLTARGGMTSHAALVARGWGKCCVVGCSAIEIHNKQMKVGKITLKEGDWITLNGSKGLVYQGRLAMWESGAHNKHLMDFLKICDSMRKLKVRTNADTPADSRKAREFGAEGIGLFRMEHMFYGKGSEVPLFKMRKMIMSADENERRKALKELFPYMKKDIKATLKAMNGFAVTIRLIDPPLHEFVPHCKDGLSKLAKALKIGLSEIKKRADVLRESNPMMGHRGVRLGVTYPEITEIQARAIFEAAAELGKARTKVFPEIMIPVTATEKEITDQKVIIEAVYKEVCKNKKIKNIPHITGTMIEIPRAALVAGKIAGVADFFSFGTNDLTQMSFGFSRDDIGGFLTHYLNRGILPDDPFQTIDQSAVGELIKIAIERGRAVKPKLKIGICGEHGGDPASIEFCHCNGFDYVSCSPFRVPIARLAAAQAVIKCGK